ncbi:MAG: MFS transporter [Muribaculaceae bacterium]|nr:MFS transporter [Muribaculaceae bacterium]
MNKQKYLIANMPLTARHYWIVFVASLGQLIGTAVATIAGIIIPMMNIIMHPELSSAMQGLIGCMDLLGIVFGSVIFGKLCDKYGYIFFFRFCPALILIFSVLAALVPNVWVLLASLFFIGLGIGGEYSLDSNYISELLPEKYRALMIGVAKTAASFGNIIAAGVCFLLILDWKNADRWPDLFWIIAGIAMLMLITRIWYYQSPKWLVLHGKYSQAEKAAEEFLGPDVDIATPVAYSSTNSDIKAKTRQTTSETENSESSSASGQSLWSFIKKNWNAVVLSGFPWACEGLGVYGIGVFLPILVMALGIEHNSMGGNPIFHVANSVEVTFWISCIILPGFVLGLYLIHKKMNIPRIQTVGFWLCAIMLIILLLAFHYNWNKWISIGAFMLFELFLNMGPHLVTYVLPPKIYPVEVRGIGSGLAASIGKIGAVLAVFIIPVLLKWGGPVLVLLVSACVMALGAIMTSVYSRKVFNEEVVTEK